MKPIYRAIKVCDREKCDLLVCSQEGEIFINLAWGKSLNS